MNPVIYKYKCDKTGITYALDTLVNTPENVAKINGGKLQVPCLQCGKSHIIIVETK